MSAGRRKSFENVTADDYSRPSPDQIFVTVFIREARKIVPISNQINKAQTFSSNILTPNLISSSILTQNLSSPFSPQAFHQNISPFYFKFQQMTPARPSFYYIIALTRNLNYNFLH
jgi:hypothetical protein